MEQSCNQINNCTNQMEELYVNFSRTCNCTLKIQWKSSALWEYVTMTVQWVVFATALPGLCYAAWRLYKASRLDQVPPPVYVINLLIFDLIQICTNPTYTVLKVVTCYCDIMSVMLQVYQFGVLGNILFMVCISAERYIMIAYPFLFITIDRLKITALVSLIIYALSAALMIIKQMYETWENYIFGVFFLLPCPIVFLFLVGTWRALSQTSIPRTDRRRVMGTLILVLCIYVVCFLPYILSNLYYMHQPVKQDFLIYLFDSIEILIALNPLFDLILYVFMRRGAVGICQHCCVSEKRELKVQCVTESNGQI